MGSHRGIPLGPFGSAPYHPPSGEPNPCRPLLFSDDESRLNVIETRLKLTPETEKEG